jgi:hypothetical protein
MMDDKQNRKHCYVSPVEFRPFLEVKAVKQTQVLVPFYIRKGCKNAEIELSTKLVKYSRLITDNQEISKKTKQLKTILEIYLFV